MKNPTDRIREAINCESAEAGSNTPDFILAEFLCKVLAAWDEAVNKREDWYGRPVVPGSLGAKPDPVTPNDSVRGGAAAPYPARGVGTEPPHPMLCFQHGGSEACEAENRKHGFTCPKCSNVPVSRVEPDAEKGKA